MTLLLASMQPRDLPSHSKHPPTYRTPSCASHHAPWQTCFERSRSLRRPCMQPGGTFQSRRTELQPLLDAGRLLKIQPQQQQRMQRRRVPGYLPSLATSSLSSSTLSDSWPFFTPPYHAMAASTSERVFSHPPHIVSTIAALSYSRPLSRCRPPLSCRMSMQNMAACSRSIQNVLAESASRQALQQVNITSNAIVHLL